MDGVVIGEQNKILNELRWILLLTDQYLDTEHTERYNTLQHSQD